MRIITVFSLLCIGIFSSCNNNPYKKDVDNVYVSLSVYPFYNEILKAANDSSLKAFKVIADSVGPFFDSFNTRMIGVGSYKSTSYADKIKAFLNESWIQDLYANVQKQFPNNEWLEEELTQAFKYYKYYFPNKTIPRVATYIAGVHNFIVIDENMLAIGLDRYLGENFLMYKQMEISSFIRRGMYKEKIPVDCMRAIAESEFPNNFKEEHLLAQMIQNGRYMYFVRSMLPEVPDSTLWGYTGKQLEYCKASESDFWKYFVSTDNMLFDADYLTVKRFIDDGPFTPVFNRESPGRIGQWMGFNIVEAFMKNNPDVSLQQLFEISDPQIIMNKAKYNP